MEIAYWHVKSFESDLHSTALCHFTVQKLCPVRVLVF